MISETAGQDMRYILWNITGQCSSRVESSQSGWVTNSTSFFFFSHFLRPQPPTQPWLLYLPKSTSCFSFSKLDFLLQQIMTPCARYSHSGYLKQNNLNEFFYEKSTMSLNTNTVRCALKSKTTQTFFFQSCRWFPTSVLMTDIQLLSTWQNDWIHIVCK